MTKKKTPKETEAQKIQRELSGEAKKCPPHKRVTIMESRNGNSYKECTDCNAFLGWC